MQIEIKEIESCKLSVKYLSTAEEILSKRGEIINHFRKAPVPGFRPGKATPQAINSHYKSQIEESLKRALAEDAYHNTLFEKKLKPHGAPKFNSMFLIDGKFSCEFDLCTKPEFELSSYKSLEVPKPHEPTTQSELTEKMLQELRVRFGDVSPFAENDFVQVGDSVLVDYTGLIDGVKNDGISAQGEMLTVGSSQLKEFDDNLLGMKLGDVREFNLKIPENGLPSLANKAIHFSVTLNMGSKTVPCALDDELAKKIGKETYAELREFVAGSASAKLAIASRDALKNAISAKLVDDNNFPVPNWLALSEAQYLAHSIKLNWDQMPDEDKEKYMEMASKNVRLSLILDRIREVEPEAQLSEQEVFDMIKQNLSKSKVQTSLDDVIKEMNRTGYLQILFSRIRDEHTLDFIIKSSKVVE